MNLAKLTPQELQVEINSYENLQCSGVNDLRYLDTLYGEVRKRGYEIIVTKKVELRTEERI